MTASYLYLCVSVIESRDKCGLAVRHGLGERPSQARSASPWSGFKDSGVGRETGIESFDHFTEVRTVTVNTTGETVDWHGDEGAPRRLN